MAEPINTGPCAPANASGISENQATTAGNSGEQKVIDSVMAEMEKQMKILDVQQFERELNLFGIAIKAIIDKCKDKSNEIVSIISNDRNPRKRLLNMVRNEIVSAADGNLITPRYVPRMAGEQDVSIYTGDYWKKLIRQKFFDMVIDCAKRIGLPDEYVYDTDFMHQLFQSVAFRVARSQERIRMKDSVFINLQNGTLVISTITGEVKLREHRKVDNFTYVLPFSYDPKAQCESFTQFLNQVLPEHEAQLLLQENIATILIPDVKTEKMLVLFGSGSNGKSVILDILEALFGAENVSHVTLADLTNDGKQRALIEDKLVNISSESNKDVNPSILKQLVSREKVTAYINYVGPITLENYGRLITSFNTLPTAENTHGFFRRWNLIPFKVTISEKDQDRNLAKKIIASELPGILNWVLEGLKRFLLNLEFTDSPLCNDALNKYRLRSDNVKLFFSECYEASESFSTPGKDLFENYKKYCYKDCLKPVGKQTFFDRFEAVAGNRFTYQNQIMFHVIQKPDNDKAPF